MPSCNKKRLIAACAAATLLAAALGGCGRKGPLELPPDVLAAREGSRAEQEAAAPKAPPGPRPKLSEEGAKPKTGPAEGDVGHRPPQAYPFFLDPLL
jgi:predicted small lipoprotein YifL